MKCIMTRFLPLSAVPNSEFGKSSMHLQTHCACNDQCLVETILQYAPSPSDAQLYRVEQLYECSIHGEDEYSNAIRLCSKTGSHPPNSVIYVRC